MVERIGERHASACRYKRCTGGLTALRSAVSFLATRSKTDAMLNGLDQHTTNDNCSALTKTISAVSNESLADQLKPSMASPEP